MEKNEKMKEYVLKKAHDSGMAAGYASDIVRGECAKEKADWLKALAAKQTCKYNIIFSCFAIFVFLNNTNNSLKLMIARTVKVKPKKRIAGITLMFYRVHR